ncbi:MAG TPA: hypothetical protein VGI71_01395 [Scandinavium sp.]|jgi:hypothetical protein
MTVEEIIARLNVGPASAAELIRAGATDTQLCDLIRVGIVTVLQQHKDDDSVILGVYQLPNKHH